MKNLFNPKLLMLVVSIFALTACEDDEKIKTTGTIAVDTEESKISSGWFLYNSDSNTDSEENEYYRNEIVLFGKGLKVEKDGTWFDVTGSGDILELMINNEGQGLQAGTYTWQSEENEQPFDLWYGVYTQGLNTDDETRYRIYSGTAVVTKSGSKYKIAFTGLAYVEMEDLKAAGLPAIPVSAEFEGKLHKMEYEF